MATLTAQQEADIRADLGDSANAFTNPELQRNWDRVAGAANDVQRHNATLALCFKQLLANASKLHDYQAGAVKENLKQVRDNLEDMYNMYAADLEAALGTGAGIVKSKVGTYPHQTRKLPREERTRRQSIRANSE